MRICHIITALDFGGAERLLLYIAQEQIKNHDFHVIYLKNQTAMMPLFPTSVTFHHAPLGFGCAGSIRKIVIDIQPDVVHTHLGHADLLGLWAIRGLNMKKYCTIHNIWYKWNKTDYIIFAIYKLLLATVARDCTVISISKAIDKHIATRFSVPSTRRVLIYNAVPALHNGEIHSQLEAKKILKLDNSTFYVLFVGRFEQQKSVHTLIEAAALVKEMHPQIKFLLVGAGSLQENIKKMSEEMKLSDNIIFVGRHNQPEIFMQAAEILVLPSIFEGLPLVVLEAFRAGLPVIASNIDGPDELIENGFNGFLFKPQKAEELANYISLIYQKPDLKKQMGINSSGLFQERFNIKTYVKYLENLYQKNNYGINN